MKFKMWKKYNCEHCGKEELYDHSNHSHIVYCQQWERFYQQFACSTECWEILEDIDTSPILYKCSKCKKWLPENKTYEYRGVYSCSDCKDEVEKSRDFERQEVIADERSRTEPLRWFDVSDSTLWKINRKILKSQIEIAWKEWGRLKAYEKKK